MDRHTRGVCSREAPPRDVKWFVRFTAWLSQGRCAEPPLARLPTLLRLNPAPTGVVHRRGPHGRLLPRDAAYAAANYEHLRPWLWPTDGVY